MGTVSGRISGFRGTKMPASVERRGHFALSDRRAHCQAAIKQLSAMRTLLSARQNRGATAQATKQTIAIEIRLYNYLVGEGLLLICA